MRLFLNFFLFCLISFFLLIYKYVFNKLCHDVLYVNTMRILLSESNWCIGEVKSKKLSEVFKSAGKNKKKKERKTGTFRKNRFWFCVYL